MELMYSADFVKSAADRLRSNLDAYVESRSQARFDSEALRLVKLSYDSFVATLLDGGKNSGMYFPAQAVDVLEATRFEFVSESSGSVRGESEAPIPYQTLTCTSRIPYNPEVIEDLTCGCFGGKNSEEVFVESFGAQAAEDVQVRLLRRIAEGLPLKLVVFYLGPYIAPSLFMKEEWSYHRRLMLNYAVI
jgi:hypothetical protein